MEGTVTVCPKCCEEIEYCFSLTFTSEEEKETFLTEGSPQISFYVNRYPDEDAFAVQIMELTTEQVNEAIDGLEFNLCVNVSDVYEGLSDGVYTIYAILQTQALTVVVDYFESEPEDFPLLCASKERTEELFADAIKPKKEKCCKGNDRKKAAMEAWLALEAAEASFCCGNYEGVDLNVELIKTL